MAMYPCQKCGQRGGQRDNSRWEFHYHDDTGMVEATCLNCGYIVSFASRRKRKIDAGIPIGSGLTVEFQTIDGKLCRKEDDGEFHEIKLKEKKGGLKITTK